MPGKSVQRSIVISAAMRDRLQQLVSQHGREFSESDLIREAIRRYLDEQEDVIGSRRHFAKSFQDRIDGLELALSFHLNVLVHLVAAGLSKEKVTTSQLIRNAVIASRRDTSLTAQIAAVRDMPDQPEKR